MSRKFWARAGLSKKYWNKAVSTEALTLYNALPSNVRPQVGNWIGKEMLEKYGVKTRKARHGEYAITKRDIVLTGISLRLYND